MDETVSGGRSKLFRSFVRSARATPLRACGVAVASTVLTLILRLTFGGAAGEYPAIVVFAMPIMLTAYVGGLPIGMLATGLSCLLARYYLLLPAHRFTVVSRDTALELISLAFTGIVISTLMGALNRARRRADNAVREHRDAELALRDAEILQSAIFNSVNFSSIATDAHGVIQIFNVGAEKMFGYLAADVVNKITPAELSDPLEVIARANALSAELGVAIAPGFEALAFKASRGIEDIYELTYVRKDGSRFPAMVSVTALRDTERTVIGYLLIGSDNTARKQADEAARETDTLLRTIHLHSIVSVTDITGRIIDVNDSFCAISGYSRGELLGQTHSIVNSGVHDAAFWSDMWLTIAAGRPWRGEVCNRTKHGSLFWVDSTIVPFLGEDGRTKKYLAIRSDITATKLAEQAVRRSEAFLDRASTIARIGAWEVDARTRATTWSAQMYRLYEVDSDFVPKSGSLDSFYTGDAPAIVAAAMLGAIEREEPWDVEIPFLTAKGRAMWVRIVGSPEIEDGVVVRVVGTLQDITERRLVEAARRASELRYHTLFDYAPDGIVIADPAGSYLDGNESMCRMLGYTRSELTTLHSSDIVVPSEREHINVALSAIQSETDYHRECQFRRKDGSMFAGEMIATQMPDGNLMAMIHDVTARNIIEGRFRRLVDSNVQGVMFWTDRGGVRTANDALLGMLGYTREDLEAGRIDWGAHTPHEFAERDRRALQEIADHGICTPYEKEYIRKDGSRVPVMVGAASFEDNPNEGVCFVIDVTERRQYEASLRDATHAAERANRAKSDFLADMSHEIRTPMNAVIGLSYLLERTELDARQLGFLASIKVASKSMVAVLNDVLDLSKIEAGELTIEWVTFRPQTLVAELVDAFAAQADERGIVLELDAPHDLPTALGGDATLLRRILTNLLSNAIKFTEHGGVTLRVRALASAPGMMTLAFVVQDTGIGIAPDAQQRLFAQFVQADSSISRRFGGTGLGLSIVKRLVTLLGGDVSLESTAGVGSAFRVVLTFAIAAADSMAPLEPAAVVLGESALRNVRVLVVDDSDINRDVTRRILELEGARVAVANNGQDAFDRLRVQPNGFDIVLMDVQMPVLDGHAATKRIRAELGLTELTIVAVTADARSSERARSVDAGMNDFIVKPFGAHALLRAILRHVTPSAADRRPRQRAGASDARIPPPTWPEIEGIDSADARSRFGDNTALFRSLLERFLAEYTDVAIASGEDESALVALHRPRMHRLRGSAGLLGATAVAQIAADAEEACTAGDLALAVRLTATIAESLARLRERAAPAIAEARVERPTSHGDTGLEPQALEDLIDQLRRQSLSALDGFTAIEATLHAGMGADAFQDLRDHMDGLRFSDAATVLEGLR